MGLKRIGVTKPELKRLYLSEKLNIYQIAKILCCHPATIGKRLHEYQIPIKRPTEKLLIDEETLENLYVSKKLSIYKIADFLDCSVRSISKKMKKYGIKGRSISKEKISKKTLVRLYHQKRLSLKEIGNLYRMSPSGILKRMRKFNLPVRNSWEVNIIHTKKPFSESSEEKAYLIGFRIGDLGVRLSSKRTNNIRVNSNTTKKEQADLIKGLFSGYSDVWISKPNKRNVISTSTILHPSFAFLLPKHDLVEKWIVANSSYMSAFVAGYVDAEGSFGVYNNRARFRLGSYDKNILKEITRWLIRYDLKTYLKLERKKKEGQNHDFWRLTVNEAGSLLRLFKLIYLDMKHKKRRGDFIKVKENIIARSRSGTISI